MVRFLIVLVALAAGGCAAGTDRVALHNQLKVRNDWAGAAQIMREEIASPRVTTDPDLHAVNIRHLFLIALGEAAAFTGLRPEMDAEALRVYQEGFRFAGRDPVRLATLHNGAGMYFSKSYRNGKALPYFRKELELRKQATDPFRLVVVLDALSAAYTDMGELQLAEHYRGEARARASAYFVVGRQLANPVEWAVYSAMLDRWSDAAWQRRDRRDFAQLWTLHEAVTDGHLEPKGLNRLTAAEYLALFGDAARADQLLEQGQRLLASDVQRFPGMKPTLTTILACKTASVRLYQGRSADAVREYDTCIRTDREAGTTITQELAVPRGRGEAYEQVGDLDRAIASFRSSIDIGERMRGSYTVAERGAFFRSITQASYWGLIRASARRAAASATPGHLEEALRAGELVRARQLGELLGAGDDITTERLRQFRGGLAADEVVLAYSLMDRHWVLLAFTADRHVAHVATHDGVSLRREVLGIATALGQPDSPLADLGLRLTQLGTLLLDPARPLLVGKTKLLVLPDGVLSAVPFEALGVGGSAYRPLVRDLTVRVAPSLRLVLARQKGRSAGAKAFFAMADPVYAKAPAPGGLGKEELAAVTRASRYLDYFTPLPETRTEVQAIATLFPRAGVDLLVGAGARESTLKRADLQGFRHVHMATHGILGGEVPGISEPALVLAEEPGEDGFLTASEVEALKLDADLTVLSACNTGAGEYFTGEGVMGLSRSFLVAGSRSVVMSLWPVASKATETFMVDFYRHLQTEASVPTALRRAKLDMMERARRTGGPEAHPFFWAPFVVFGG